MSLETFIASEKQKPYFKKLRAFLKQEREKYVVYPDQKDVFKAFEITNFDQLAVVIIGQDPYYLEHQAMGLSFSVYKDTPLPKSLKNIFKELKEDLGIENHSGDLSSWATQGVLLLNTTLTTRAHQPLSHRNKGWEIFTRAVLEHIIASYDHLVFVCWGNHAKQFIPLIARYDHCIIQSAHPSPLSAYRGFFKSRPFSRSNDYLRKHHHKIIDWRTF